jgi:hypothetical protein
MNKAISRAPTNKTFLFIADLQKKYFYRHKPVIYGIKNKIKMFEAINPLP